MNYYVFIDESGGFNRIDDYSIVGAGITNISYSELELALKEAEKKCNSQVNHNFDIDKDIHISPLLHAETASSGSDKQRGKFNKIPIKERELFAKECLNACDDIFEKFVFSENKGFDFGKIDAQERYGLNLIACINETLSYLNNKKDIKSINIYIAPRSAKCLPRNRDHNTYHDNMTSYLKNCFSNSISKNINLTIGYDKKKKKKLGLDTADIICYYHRHSSEIINKKSIVTKPNQFNFEQGSIAKENLFYELIKNKEFDTAYRWTESRTEKERVLKEIEKTDEKTKITAISSILNIGYSLIDKRTIEKDALRNADELFRSIIMITKNSKNEEIIECLLSATNGLLVCANHSGHKDAQENAFRLYTKTMQSLSHIPYFTRQEKILSIRNRAYNVQFNDYRFQEIIDDFESIVKERLEKLPENEIDGLTGEMLGAIGQAYAFQSRSNKKYAKLAEEYFRNSLIHFTVGHKYHQMSVNYLAILKWYQGDIKGAIKEFAEHSEIENNKTIEENIINVINSDKYDLGSPFNLSLLLRLVSSTNKNYEIEKEKGYIQKIIKVLFKPNLKEQKKIIKDIDLKELNKFILNYDISEHPYELIYKWLGVAYLNINDFQNAIDVFEKSILLSNKLGFTVQTISISTIGLKCIALQKSGKEELLKSEIIKLENVLSDLTEKSINFSMYIESIGGLEKMLNDINVNDINEVAKWMPFSYA